jgi:hypothetical protein
MRPLSALVCFAVLLLGAFLAVPVVQAAVALTTPASGTVSLATNAATGANV